MKNMITVLLLYIALQANAFATAQMGDLLIYEGKTEGIFSNPLESYFNEEHPRPNELFKASCSANWRGYLATWEIKDGFLYLNRLVEGNCSNDAAEIPLSKVFPEQKAPIKAVWFSGILRIPQGEQLQYVHMGYGSTYERELHLVIKDGKLVDKKVIDNTQKPLPTPNEQTFEELEKLRKWEERIK